MNEDTWWDFKVNRDGNTEGYLNVSVSNLRNITNYEIILENEYDDMTEADDKVKIDPLRYEKLVTDTAKTWPELFPPSFSPKFFAIFDDLSKWS